MASRLVGIAGPARGSLIPLDHGEVVLGRDPSYGTALPDPTISSRHCIIRRHAGHFTIAGVDAASPVFVNGLPTGRSTRRLTSGDEISIGQSVFLLLQRDIDTVGHVVLVDETEPVEMRRELKREDLLLNDSRPGIDGPESETGRDLAPLLKIGTAISAVHGLVALQAPLLDLLLDIVPADRVALVLLADASPDIESMSGCDRVRGKKAHVPVSRPLLARALSDGVAVLASGGAHLSGAHAVETAGSAESATQRDMRGRMVVAPLVTFDRVLGALYADADAGDRFTERHLHLVMLVASMAAIAFDNARNIERLEQENRGLHAELDLEHDMVGDSTAMRALYQRVGRVAATDSTALISGESGTGKELIARAIHRNSQRAGRPFVAVNCAAITESLLESEMFGHERGAFTGALAQKKGRFELADGGTLFLDEIGELPVPLQAKLLRALQEQEFERVGGTRPVRVNVRLVAATNRDLASAIRNGTFRQDLYYRLNVVSLHLPPLRERREDIAALARHFARTYGAAIRHRPVELTQAALDRLCAHDWPGNVRELENTIERAVVLATSQTLGTDDFRDVTTVAPSRDTSTHAVGPYHDAVDALKKDLVRRAIDEAGGNVTAAARLLELHPNYLHRLMRNLQVRPAMRQSPVRTD